MIEYGFSYKYTEDGKEYESIGNVLELYRIAESIERAKKDIEKNLLDGIKRSYPKRANIELTSFKELSD